MSEENVKRLSKLIDGLITPVKEIVEVIKHKVNRMEFLQTGNSENIRMLRDQQSVINKKLDEQSKNLNGHGKKLDILWEQTDELTKDMNDVKETLETHTNALKQIIINTTNSNDNIKRLDKRITETEKSLGIVAPPESYII